MFTFGIDAEYIVRDHDGKLVSCHELPSKGNYTQVKDGQPVSLQGSYGCDGIFMEATSAPTTCRNQLFSSLWRSLRAAFFDISRRHNHGILERTLRMDPATEVELSAEELDALPREASEVGCVPSLNVYGDIRGPEPGSFAGMTRWTGFHIHSSMRADTMPPTDEFVRFLDRTVGVASVAMDALPDQAKRRRQSYGEAGCFRVRTTESTVKRGDPYWNDARARWEGAKEPFTLNTTIVEYRVPSGVLAYFQGPVYVLPGLVRCPDAATRERVIKVVDDATVRSIINDSDREAAVELLRKLAADGMLDYYIRRELSTVTAPIREQLPDFIVAMGRMDRRPSEYWGQRTSLQESLRSTAVRPYRVFDLASRLYRTRLEYGYYPSWQYSEDDEAGGGETK